jgi:hypothetical protein
MVTLDSMKLGVSRAVLLDFKSTAFKTVEETDGRTHKTKRSHKILPVVIGETCGLGAVEIGEERASIEVSGKILHELYPQGINLETIERVTDEINRTGVLFIDRSRFLDEAEVFRCDACVNLPVTSIEASLLNLRILELNDRWNVTPYGKTGIVAQHRGITVDRRVIFYDKETELKTGRNRKWVDSGSLDPEAFKGVLRGETNIRRYEDIRKLLDVEDPRRLLDVLASEENPVLKIFEMLCDHPLIRTSENGYAELSAIRGGYAELRKEVGDLGVFERCGWEWAVIESVIKNRYSGKSKPSRMLKLVRGSYERAMRDRGNPVSIVKGLDEIRALLRFAA